MKTSRVLCSTTGASAMPCLLVEINSGGVCLSDGWRRMIPSHSVQICH